MIIVILVPEAAAIEGWSFICEVIEGTYGTQWLLAMLYFPGINDVVFTVRDNLISDLNKEASHAFSSAIILSLFVENNQLTN